MRGTKLAKRDGEGELLPGQDPEALGMQYAEAEKQIILNEMYDKAEITRRKPRRCSISRKRSLSRTALPSSGTQEMKRTPDVKQKPSVGTKEHAIRTTQPTLYNDRCD